MFARYMMLALENRIHRDERSMGKLFYSVCNELSDITWIEAFRLLLETFIAALPAALRNKLLQCA